MMTPTNSNSPNELMNLGDSQQSDDLRSVDVNTRRRKQVSDVGRMGKDTLTSASWAIPLLTSTTASHRYPAHTNHSPNPSTPTHHATIQPMMEKDVKYIQKLVDKHGDDTEAMARDIKLNVRQLTGKNLEKMVARFKLL